MYDTQYSSSIQSGLVTSEPVILTNANNDTDLVGNNVLALF